MTSEQPFSVTAATSAMPFTGTITQTTVVVESPQLTTIEEIPSTVRSLIVGPTLPVTIRQVPPTVTRTFTETPIPTTTKDISPTKIRTFIETPQPVITDKISLPPAATPTPSSTPGRKIHQ